MKKHFLILCMIIITVTGCNNSNMNADIKMNCDDIINNINVKENDIISCTMNDKKYELNVLKVTEDSVKFNVLSNDLKVEKSNKTEITLNKDNNLELNIKDTEKKIVLSWK